MGQWFETYIISTNTLVAKGFLPMKILFHLK